MHIAIQRELSKPSSCHFKTTLLTVGIYITCWVAVGFVSCGRHFHGFAVLPTLIPLAWSIYLLRSYTTACGRVGSWIAFFSACVLLWSGFEGNLKFGFPYF